MDNLVSIRGTYIKENIGEIEIKANPVSLMFEIRFCNGEKKIETAPFSEGVNHDGIDWFRKAIYNDGEIVFEKNDSKSIQVTFKDKPEYSGKWIKKE